MISENLEYLSAFIFGGGLGAVTMASLYYFVSYPLGNTPQSISSEYNLQESEKRDSDSGLDTILQNKENERVSHNKNKPQEK